MIKKDLGSFILDKQWQVNNGEIITLFGPSGSGKSLTLKCIAGLIEPENGFIRLGETYLFNKSKNINLTPQERKVGYVPQQYGLFPHMTVGGNVGYGLVSKSKREKKEIIEALLKKVGLQDKTAMFPWQLSGGEKQRVALLRTLSTSPKVLLLDEPFSAVDATMRQRLREEVKEFLHQFFIPVVLVTHDPSDAEFLSTKVIKY